MKRIVALLMLFAILLSCCACGENPKEIQGENSSDQILTPEDMYGHIDQSVPIDGYYKLWNAEGVKGMINHPEGKFELLCNIDMGGATLAPIPEFTGTIKGGNFTISNFTLQGGEEESFGFLGVNKGKVQNFLLKDVTFIPGAKAKNIGSLVGDNKGEIVRCTVTGTMDVTAAADNANCGSIIGCSTGSLENTVADVNVNITAPGVMTVGGIVGTIQGGSVQYTDSNGRLDVTGSNKTAGLFAGNSVDSLFTNCAFVGASNTLDGKLFINLTGNPDDDELVVAPHGLYRDNVKEILPENVQKLRNTVAQKMYDMGSVEWFVDKDLKHVCKCGTTYVCDGLYLPGYTYIGMPYKHGSGSLASFNYCLDENGFMKDWVYDMETRNGYDTYIGSMCSSASQMAWWTVSNSVDHMVCLYMLPQYPEYGCIPVGTGWYENAKLNSRADTVAFVDACTEQVFFEALADTHIGDCVVNGLEAGDHVRMVAAEPVVVRDQLGNIDGEKSYLLTHEQRGSYTLDEENKTWTSWRLNYKYSFNVLRGDWYVPVTIEELLTGEMEPAECKMLDNPGGKLGLTVGTVKANYYLETVTLKIADSQGNVVLDKLMFPKAAKFDRGNARQTNLSYIDSYNMANFATVLQDVSFKPGETYTYSVSAGLATGDSFLVLEDSFTQGGTK